MNAGDFSREAFEADLGPDVMALIDAQVAAAPPPSPRTVERLRQIFAPAVALLTEQHAGAELADAA